MNGLLKKPTLKEVKWTTEHWRARQNYGKRKDVCLKCKKQIRTILHHINGNWHDNKVENLMELCKSCHYRIHFPILLCKLNGCKFPRRRYGYCNKHSQRFWKFGDPFLIKKKNGNIIKLEK